jgi:hypothetical protein
MNRPYFLMALMLTSYFQRVFDEFRFCIAISIAVIAELIGKFLLK